VRRFWNFPQFFGISGTYVGSFSRFSRISRLGWDDTDKDGKTESLSAPGMRDAGGDLPAGARKSVGS
jgi:hypothetical protein